jgi:hypothetical protein
LFELFGNFHDGCLKELKYISGEYVAENLSMYPINSQRKLSVIFQRQRKSPSAIEIIFDGLIKLNLEPNDEHYDGIIFDSFMVIKDNLIYWADTENFSFDNLNNCTWIVANKAKWRIADEYIGEEEIYISK